MNAACVVVGCLSAPAHAFDIEAHRGGRALYPENTLQSFAHALSLGVDTLELDMEVTKDDVIVVSHERRLNPDLAQDAHGVYVSEPGTPFVRLTLGQVETYDVGTIRPGSEYAKRFTDQRSVPGTRIPTLAQVFALVRRSGNAHVRLNIETKIDPTHPDESPDPAHFVAVLRRLLHRERFVDRVMVESFDWRTLRLLERLEPRIATVYLSAQLGEDATVFLDRASPWTAGFDPMAYGGSVPRAVKAAGGAVWSPLYEDVTPALIDESHRLGLKVVVWTVNEPADMTRLMDLGVDGIISDRPDLLRQAAAERGWRLPVPTPVDP